MTQDSAEISFIKSCNGVKILKPLALHCMFHGRAAAAAFDACQVGQSIATAMTHLLKSYWVCSACVCFGVSTWHFNFEWNNSAGSPIKSIMQDRQWERVKKREKNKSDGGKKRHSLCSSLCRAMASDSTSFPVTTDDKATTFASRARACSFRKRQVGWDVTSVEPSVFNRLKQCCIKCFNVV